MKNLKRKLESFLRDYEVDMKFLKVEDFTTTLPTALDWELAQTSLERKDLERYKNQLTKDQLERLEKADQKALEVYNQIKDLEFPTTPTIVARAILEEIVKVIQKNSLS